MDGSKTPKPDRSASMSAPLIEPLTLASGAPVGDKLNSLLLGAVGPNLMTDTAYLEEMAHVNRERIPERVAHAKGAGALGFFQVTDTRLTKFCKASLFSTMHKKTPIAVRFSHVVGESGYPDSVRDLRGFAVRFYTDQGNLDLVGNNLPVFFVRDPINFGSFLHSQKRNPRSNLPDPDAVWDLLSLLPESMHATLMRFADRGIPDGFRHMHGYAVHTFKLVNSEGEQFYAKFKWRCNQKIRNLDNDLAARLAGKDPDYYLRDLFVNIETGNAPTWTLQAQVMTWKEANKAAFNAFDVTKIWPHSDYPPFDVGILKLDRNPDNHFAQVEQLAMSPANLVPGIEASPDKMLVGRMVSYPDAQRYRLGINYPQLPCNAPRCPVMTPTYRDGRHATCPGLRPEVASMPNYVPSSRFKGNPKLFDERYLESQQKYSATMGRYDLSHDDNLTQPRVFVNRVLDKEARERLARNLSDSLRLVKNKTIVGLAMSHFNDLDPDFAKMIERFMMTGNRKIPHPAKSPASAAITDVNPDKPTLKP